MSVITTVTLIAVGTGVLAGLIVLADVDLRVVRIFQDYGRELGRTYARQPEPWAPAEPPRPLPWVAPQPRLAAAPAWSDPWAADEAIAPTPRLEDLSEGERWLAEMAAYASRGAGSFPRQDGEVTRPGAAGTANPEWEGLRGHLKEAS